MHVLARSLLSVSLCVPLAACPHYVYEGPSGTFTEIRREYADPPRSIPELIWAGIWGDHGPSAHGRDPKTGKKR